MWGFFVCRTLMRPLTFWTYIMAYITQDFVSSFTKDKGQVRRTHKIKSSDAQQHSVLTTLTAPLGKSHAVTLVSITSPQLQRCTHTPLSKFCVIYCFWCISQIVCEHFQLSHICSTSSSTTLPFKPVKNHRVLLYHVSTSYGVPWLCGLVGFVCCF